MWIVIAPPRPGTDARRTLYVERLVRDGTLRHTERRSEAKRYKTMAGAQKAADAGNAGGNAAWRTYIVVGAEG
jgi:hypothetical protein